MILKVNRKDQYNKSCSFKRANKTDKPLAILISRKKNKKRERTKIKSEMKEDKLQHIPQDHKG